MAYNSFYGGRQGASFTIVKNFNTIEEMVENFKKGADYKIVSYDEYVLISTLDRYSKDNGKIYRRGYDYSNELGGAIYIGQISGAPGPSPYLELATIDEVKETYETAGNQDIYRQGSGEYEVTNNSLVPGKYEENGEIKFNDKIQWAYCSFVEEELGVAKIGFTTPYLVNDFTVTHVPTHYQGDLIERTDDMSHPFYSKWNILLPKGIKGESLNNFRVIKANSDIQPYEGQEDDINNEREILVYDFIKYDNKEEGELVSIYLGDYNMIDDIIISDEGTIKLNYSHDNDYVREKLFKWIKSVSLTAGGHFTVEYNHEKDAEGNPTIYETDLTWVNDIDINKEGTITFSYSTGEEKVLDRLFKTIDTISLDEQGHFTITYNHNEDADGKATIYETDLTWVNNITLSETGVITVYYSTGEEEILNDKIKWIKDVVIDTGAQEGDGTQQVVVSYNDNSSEAIGNPLNYIIRTAVTNDFHLVALHSDPEKRAQIVAQGQGYTWEGRNDWQDLGSIKSEKGVLFGLTYNPYDYPGEMGDIAAIVDKLNEMHPDGLVGEGLQGRVITVGSSELEKSIYAFDYSLDENKQYRGWYYLGTIDGMSGTNTGILVGREGDAETEAYAHALPIHGAWFIVE